MKFRCCTGGIVRARLLVGPVAGVLKICCRKSWARKFWHLTQHTLGRHSIRNASRKSRFTNQAKTRCNPLHTSTSPRQGRTRQLVNLTPNNSGCYCSRNTSQKSRFIDPNQSQRIKSRCCTGGIVRARLLVGPVAGVLKKCCHKPRARKFQHQQSKITV